MRSKKRLKKNNMTIHVALYGGAAGSMRAAFPSDIVVEFCDTLSFGPLYSFTPLDISARLHWLTSLFQTICSPEWSDVALRRTGLSSLSSAVHHVGEIIFWIGDNTDEQLMLRAILSECQPDVASVINVTQLCGRGTVGECSPDLLPPLLAQRVALSAAERQVLSQQWQQSQHENAPVRVFEQGEILGKSSDYYDRWLLAAMSHEFVRASRIVGEVMGSSPQRVSEFYLDFRLRELIAQGAIRVDGEQVSMNRMMIGKA
jgi:hypothetical protein